MISYGSENDYFIVTASQRREADDLELLFLARAVDFTSEKQGRGRRFFVSWNQADFARGEVEAFVLENRQWPPPIRRSRRGWFRFSPLHLAVVFGLAWFHWRVLQTGSLIPWMDRGLLSAEKVLAGERARTLTALTLHLDEAHLFSNFLGLLLFVGGVHQLVGSGVAWLLVIGAGALGNWLTAVFYQTGHEAVGASTAVFGAVGIMGALGVKRYFRDQRLGGAFLIPLLGALGLFAMLGTDPRTDVAAHLFGLSSGVGLGLAFIPLAEHHCLTARSVQGAALLLTGAAIGYAWRVQLEGAEVVSSALRGLLGF